MNDCIRLLSWSKSNLAPPREPTEIECARALLRQRRTRASTFGQARILFHDPAWEIVLELFIAHEEGRAITSAALEQWVATSSTTLHRWLRAMEQEGVTACWPAPDPSDGIMVALTPGAIEMMLRFLNEV